MELSIDEHPFGGGGSWGLMHLLKSLLNEDEHAVLASSSASFVYFSLRERVQHACLDGWRQVNFVDLMSCFLNERTWNARLSRWRRFGFTMSLSCESTLHWGCSTLLSEQYLSPIEVKSKVAPNRDHNHRFAHNFEWHSFVSRLQRN